MHASHRSANLPRLGIFLFGLLFIGTEVLFVIAPSEWTKACALGLAGGAACSAWFIHSRFRAKGVLILAAALCWHLGVIILRSVMH